MIRQLVNVTIKHIYLTPNYEQLGFTRCYLIDSKEHGMFCLRIKRK